MIKYIKIFFIINFTFNIFIINQIKAEIYNEIIVKVGNEIITTLDLKNEVITYLIINKIEINQENIDRVKQVLLKKLINLKIKKNEINRFAIKDYNKNDLQEFIKKIAETFDTNSQGLKDLFEINEINYDTFIKNYEIELLWNSLIFNIYKNQININVIEIENEINKLKSTSSEEVDILKNRILNQKKQEKLNLYSRSHFTNLENSIPIVFK